MCGVGHRFFCAERRASAPSVLGFGLPPPGSQLPPGFPLRVGPSQRRQEDEACHVVIVSGYPILPKRQKRRNSLRDSVNRQTRPSVLGVAACGRVCRVLASPRGSTGDDVMLALSSEWYWPNRGPRLRRRRKGDGRARLLRRRRRLFGGRSG